MFLLYLWVRGTVKGGGCLSWYTLTLMRMDLLYLMSSLLPFFFSSVINYLRSDLGEFLEEPKIAFTAN